MKTKLKQIYYDMRHQPVIAWVTFLATAMSVFLIMVVVMMQRAKTVPFAPESCRENLVIGANLHIENIDDAGNNSSSALSYSAAKMLYDGLDGIDCMTFYTMRPEESEVYAPGGDDFITAQSRRADAGFFEVFDHPLVEGRYFTAEEANALMPLAVINESTARKILGNAPWAGREIIVDNSVYTVTGVICDNSSLATLGHAEIVIPTGPGDTFGQWTDYLGSMAVAMVKKPGVDMEHLRNQVKARYSKLDAQLAAEGRRTIYHEAPYEQSTLADAAFFGSNTTPDASHSRRMRWVIYGILLIVPAINLSSMLHSRMRRRVNEIGVRRAFGCTRRRIITDIITENFIVTLAGGFVGVTLGIIFAATYSGLYEGIENYNQGDTPAVSAFLNFATIATSLIICFVLNILSASVPAWQAARMNPVEALNSK